MADRKKGKRMATLNVKSPEINLDSEKKARLFTDLLFNKGKTNEELIKKIKATPSIPRRKK
ncbi:hypothetical protein [Paenibacillus silvae]|uniref:Uncharacterized protein n=1 Tax=Paenibacillus silvae TaxID=1325358 RepID=A0A2W6NNS8_9BACL|nr:hypothetical protein [Paenibacillus silvae]PZT57512.1 hypothetical protein DN757_02335 [Paenibacillus silvae]